MKAVYINEPGGPEKLVFGDRPEPIAGSDQVVLRLWASALNFADLNVREGRRSTGGLPRILGLDMAGEVAQVGSGVTGFAEGDRVLVDNRLKCGMCKYCTIGRDEYCVAQRRLGTEVDGSHAQYCVVPAINVHKFPDWTSFEEAAAFPIAGHTAWHCLVTQGKLQPWEDILIQAAGSGVGSMAILIAKMIGARVITTAGSDWKLEKARELGADEVINYTTIPNFSQRVMELTDGKGVDMIFDVVGASVWDENLLSLGRGGRLVNSGSTSGTQVSMNINFLRDGPLHLMGSGGRGRRTFIDMMRAVWHGKLRGIVGRTFPLEEVAEAHKNLESRDFFGKLVIQHP